MPEHTEPVERDTFLAAAHESHRAAAEAQAAALRYLARTILGHDTAATGLRVDVDICSEDGELRPSEILIDGRAAAYGTDDIDPGLWTACEQLKPGELFARYARPDPSVRAAYLIDLRTAKDATACAEATAARRLPVAVDPAGCRCTACISGEHIPLDRADAVQVAALLRGDIQDNTGADLEIAVIARLHGAKVLELGIDPAQLGVRATAHGSGTA